MNTTKYLVLERNPESTASISSMTLLEYLFDLSKVMGSRLRVVDSLSESDLRQADFVFEIKKERYRLAEIFSDTRSYKDYPLECPQSLDERESFYQYMSRKLLQAEVDKKTERHIKACEAQARLDKLDPDKMHGAEDGFPGSDF